MLDRLRNYISNLWKRATSTEVTMMGKPPVYPTADLDRFIEDGYAGSDAVYSIVEMICRKFSYIPRYVVPIEDKEAAKAYKGLKLKTSLKAHRYFKKAFKDQVVDNAYSRLLARPNPYMGQDTFFFACSLFYELTGDCFIWLNRGDADKDDQGNYLPDMAIKKLPVFEMYVLPSNKVAVIPKRDDRFAIVGYEVTIEEDRWIVPEANMIHWKRYNPLFDGDQYRGQSPLKAGNKLMTQYSSANDQAVAMYQNGGAKGVLYTETLSKPTPKQESEVSGVVNRKINNNSMKQAVAWLNGKWGYLDLSMSGVDLELLDGSETAYKRLARLFGVPWPLLDSESTYANVQQAGRDFITGKIMPMCNSLRDEMAIKLEPAFDMVGDYTHQCDFSELPEMQADYEKLSNQLGQLFDRGALTPDEIREAFNYERTGAELHQKFYMKQGYLDIEDVRAEEFNPDDLGGDIPLPG